MLITTIEQLAKYCPFLQGYDPYEGLELQSDDPRTAFDKFEGDVETAERFLQTEVLGSAIYKIMDADLIPYATAVVAYKSAIDFIPAIDLSYEDGGFMAASNDNMNPASKARMERLVESYIQKLSTAIESLQLYIEDTPTLHASWSGVKYCSYFADMPCTHNRVFKQYAIAYDGNSYDFIKLRAQMVEATNAWIVRRIGQAQYQDLIDNPQSENNVLLIHNFRMAWASMVMGKRKSAHNIFNSVYATLKSKADNYPLFKEHYGTPVEWDYEADNNIMPMM